MKTQTGAILRWYLAALLAVLVLTGCSGVGKAPVATDVGRDSQLTVSTATETQIIQGMSVEYLGKAIDPVSGKTVEGYLFRHPVGLDWSLAEADRIAAATDTCYGFLADGAKWKHIESWLVNPAKAGLTGSFILSNMTSDIAKWEDAADGVPGDGSYIDILGNGSLTNSKLSLSKGKPNGKNAVLFGKLGASTIAVTIIWGVFSGPVENRELIEWDQQYNTAFAWSMSGEPGKMDFENIATHELGHSCGLDDQYSSACSEVTMYGYASYGETKKRTLEDPDITGISTLY